jgi:hypothetical protein
MSKTTFTNNIDLVADMLKEQAVQFLYEAGGELLTQVTRNVPVDSGDLKGSFKLIVDEDELVAYVGSPQENAIWTEFGTGEYAVNGDGRKGAWYVPVDKVVGKSKPTYEGKLTIVYGKNKKAYYKTDGKQPTRYFTNAYDKVKPKIERRLKSIMKGQ